MRNICKRIYFMIAAKVGYKVPFPKNLWKESLDKWNVILVDIDKGEMCYNTTLSKRCGFCKYFNSCSTCPLTYANICGTPDSAFKALVIAVRKERKYSYKILATEIRDYIQAYPRR